MMDRSTDTIMAAATPSNGAITIVRLSGPACRFVLETMAGGVPPSRLGVVRHLRDADGEILDQALVLFFPGPRSYTGEDCAELHLHGGRAVLARVSAALLIIDGIRPAQPGEFTRRAFLNGRMDLTEAEGLADLIASETESQRRQALRQMEGVLGRQIEAWRQQLIGALALAEAELDFSDERDVPEGLIDRAWAIAVSVCDEVEMALHAAARGERIRDGYRVVIAGPPNAGKSSLLNAIAGRDVAIVTEMAGTTRDLIEVRCDIGGLPITFIDTAGLRDSQDPVEVVGMARARDAAREADLVVLLEPADCRSDGLVVEAPRTIRVRSKIDLAGGADRGEDLGVSARTGEGISALLDLVREIFDSGEPDGTALVTRERHRRLLGLLVSELRQIETTPNSLPELTAEHLRRALEALAEITGRFDSEMVLDEVFRGFCIGK